MRTALVLKNRRPFLRRSILQNECGGCAKWIFGVRKIHQANGANRRLPRRWQENRHDLGVGITIAQAGVCYIHVSFGREGGGGGVRTIVCFVRTCHRRSVSLRVAPKLELFCFRCVLSVHELRHECVVSCTWACVSYSMDAVVGCSCMWTSVLLIH